MSNYQNQKKNMPPALPKVVGSEVRLRHEITDIGHKIKEHGKKEEKGKKQKKKKEKEKEEGICTTQNDLYNINKCTYIELTGAYIDASVDGQYRPQIVETWMTQ